MRAIQKAQFLGDFVLSPYRFENLDAKLLALRTQEYLRLNHKEKSERVNHLLLDLILQAPKGTFLLIAVVEFIDAVAHDELLINYTINSFEIWLNQLSGLSDKDNYMVRAKIVGKWIPRDEYQAIFPVGMGKVHPGSHFVTAHASPDLDTTIASFWGWVDAFGARVSEGVHIWNVPGGAPASSIEVALLFHHIFGKNAILHLAKTRISLGLSSLELMTQRGVVKQQTDQSALLIDHERSQKAVILVDEWGYYLGDWRSFDVEGVRQVIMLLNNCLRWFENALHMNIVSFFAKENLTVQELPKLMKEVFDVEIRQCDPAKEFTEKQARHMEGYLQKVLKVKKGLSATFAEFADAMKGLALFDFQECINKVRTLDQSGLFDAKGRLIEDRPKIFHYLEEVIALLDRAIQSVRLYTERLKVALDIKTQVFGYLPQVVSYRADLTELRSKMGGYPYLTVTSTDEEGRMIPLGVVRARDIQEPILGTVTLRDFCNREETKIPSYFEVISVIDHHKTSLNTSSAPVVYITDAQSSNSVVAELAFHINDSYSSGGMTIEEIRQQMDPLQNNLKTPMDKRILRKLLKRLNAALHIEPSDYFVDPLREFIEYLHFLYAILDDTDLLTKVSRRDVDCVARLLNRMKSLMEGRVVEIIQFDDLPHDERFVQAAANRILQHPDMYSLYKKIYLAKEQLVEENLQLCFEGKPSNIFADTKIQNGCARVGQTKMFANNYPSFQKNADRLHQTWLNESKGCFEDRRDVNLFMHMLSTIAGAEDLYSGKTGDYSHPDELWIWIPMTDQAIENLKAFLNAFRSSPQIEAHKNEIDVEFLGPNGKELAKIFKESFLEDVPFRFQNGNQDSYVIIHYPAGAINSRKAMISPYLPTLIG